tara:strand:- start:508 stop:1266 length:759 start_codon:yes stop_codon:yes gene_type:complete
LKRWLFAQLIFSSFISFSTTSVATPLKVAQSEWAPYIMDSPVGKGIAHDIVTMGLANAGYKFHYEQKPWPRVLKETYYGKNDVIVAIWKNTKRERHYYFTEPYMSNKLSVISRAEDKTFEYIDLTSLTDKRVALIEDYAYPSELLDHDSIIPVTSANLETSMRLLLSNRADTLVTDEYVARWIIKKMGLPMDRFKFHSIPLTTTPLYAAVRKDHPFAQQIIYSLNYYFRNIPSEQVHQLQIKYGLVSPPFTK